MSLLDDGEDEQQLLERLARPRPPPRIKMKLAPYAMYCVFFSGAGPRRGGNALGAAYAGLHFALYLVRFLTVSPVAEVAAFWAPVHFAIQCACYAATALVICAFIRWHMAVDGVYRVEFVPPPELMDAAEPAPATAVEQQLPPPPPEMDMC
ncbi:unnamed protein product [Urochloa humidicola]